MTKILSWNLLHQKGAKAADVTALVQHEQPDLLLLQEATPEMDVLPTVLGGYYVRTPLPGRAHGLVMWSRVRRKAPHVVRLPSGALIDRVAQVIELDEFAVANVHLSHGQMLNRRQLRHIAAQMPYRAAVLGDYNLVGPALLPGFRDVGPRESTHVCADMLPLRLDRCYVRGLACEMARALDRASSDHRPITVQLEAQPLARAA